ncbi:MAG: AsmA-like C-terminal domain-containing protein [Proteobacteria bacterium]|nr:AsmA-like C-terminal domain-containing protein [Pseudomonadota bacterium]
MANSEPEQLPGKQARRPRLGRVAAGLIRAVLRLCFGIAALAVVIAGLLYLRLSQGPIHLPVVARIATEMFNSESGQLRLELGDLVLSMGEAGAPAGIRFIDLKVRNADGETLFAVPRLAATFDTSDLLRGELRPTRIVLIGPEARLLRTREGKFRFGLGAAPAGDDGAGDALVGETPQLAAIAGILDGLVGDAEPLPVLTRLNEIVISGADLTYENAAIGRRWHTRRADLRIVRAEAGLLARLSIGLADGDETGAAVVVTAERRRDGGGATRIDLRFDNLRPEHLAEQLDQMQWLRLIDAPLDGNLGATVHADGRIEGLTGRISSAGGRILALRDLREQGQPFESFELAFAYEAGLERMQVSELALVSPALDARLSGFVDLRRGADGGVTGLAGQFEIAEIRASVPDVFAEPLHFDGGQIVARLSFEPMRIEVAEAHLRSGDLVLDVSGNAWAAEDGWHTDLRAAGRNLTVAQLVRHWPLVAAKNARKWVAKNIHSGSIDEFVAHMRFGAGAPLVNLDFVYSGLVSSYLKEMSPIVEARGRGSLTQREFNLFLESGEIVPVEGSPVRLDGSVMRIPNLRVEHAPAEVIIRGAGATASILALIDQHPLGLMAKLGLDPATIGGEAEVTVNLGFPLITTLKLDQVEVEADARLFAVRLPFRLPGGQVLDVAGAAVTLKATKRELNLSGAVRIDGSSMVLGWTENFGRGPHHRTIALKGAATPALLERFGLGNAYFVDGRAPMKLRLTQTGSPEFAFDLDADLGPARLEIAEFGWQKAPGPEGRLEAAGFFGDGIRVTRFRLDTGDLKAVGAVEFAPGGAVRAARIERFRFRGLADVALVAARTEAGAGGPVMSLKVSGRRLDLALFDDSPGGGAGGGPGGGSGGATALAVEFDLDELVVTPRVIARPASGSYRRDRADNAVADLAGRLAGKVPFTAQYERSGGEPARVVVRSDDAGALLKAAGLFAGAEGGRLKLKARIVSDGEGAIIGTARIKDVRISGASTFKSILDQGGVEAAASAAEGSGLAFDRVKVPFEFRGGVLTLDDAIAKGTLLAVKVAGTVDENSDEIDLVGVISPAYALTGLVDSIPLLGDILTGGKGEGILAMTFTVRGSLEEPEFSVNPLSLLAPGILRKLFSGRNTSPDEDFIEGLKRELD